MPLHTITLNDEEYQAVMDMRAQKTFAEQVQYRAEVLEKAAAYLRWMYDNGISPGSSTVNLFHHAVVGSIVMKDYELLKHLHADVLEVISEWEWNRDGW